MRLAALMAAVALSVTGQQLAGEPADREQRFFSKQALFVKDAAQTKLTIETVPSSCVVVEPSLPPCRGMRGFKIAPSPTNRMEKTAAPRLSWRRPAEPSQWLLPSKADIADTLSRWGSYIGLPPLVSTRTREASSTRRVHDPAVMVTFSVVGCRPTRLPFELAQCPRAGPTVAVQGASAASTTELLVEGAD